MQKNVANASRIAEPSVGVSMSPERESTRADKGLRKLPRTLENVNETSGAGRSDAEKESGTCERKSDTADAEPERPRRTIRQIREAAQSKTQAREESQSKPPTPSPVPQKKKSSILGGLFQVREPTQLALNQVAAQMVAQHGSTSPTKVPNVRLEKMPEFVPRVNSKWDGIPEGVKQRQRKEKERANDSKRDHSGSTHPRTGSRDTKDGERASVHSRNSSSTTDSFASRGRSSGSHTTSTRTRVYAPSANSSGDLASQQRTDRSLPRTNSKHNPSKPASAESLPEVSASRREAQPILGRNNSLQPYADRESNPSNSGAGDRTAVGRLGLSHAPSTPHVEPVPIHSTSPMSTPLDLSPVTPTVSDTQSGHSNTKFGAPKETVALTSSGVGVLGPPAVATTKAPNPLTAAFLAGEAQELTLSDNRTEPRKADLPTHGRGEGGRNAGTAASRKQKDLEKRPDSSRVRLGLQASMVVEEEEDEAKEEEQAKPRKVRGEQQPSGSSSKPGMVSSARTASDARPKFNKPFAFFGKDKDKSSG